MKPKSLSILVVSLFGLLAAMVLLAAPPVQAAVRTTPSAEQPFAGDDVLRATATETVTTFIISNEAPGHLVDWLIANGHGDDTLLQVLAYLKSQSNGAIPDAFYNQVAAAPPGSEVFTAKPGNYAELVGGIEIAADGTVYIPSIEGKDYVGTPGFMTGLSQEKQFTLTYTQNAAYYIYTHGQDYGGGVTKNYYAFGIAWKPEIVTTFILSNEAPEYLVDYLIAQGHGNETLFEVLGYLKTQSGGIIPDAWYSQVAAALPGSEVWTATLNNYAGLVGGIEICADGTLYIPNVEGRSYEWTPGFATALSQNGQFTFTYSQDVGHDIFTHQKNYGSGQIKNYFAFGIAWREGYTDYLPLVVR
jgi:hypothetical protein